MSGKTEFPVDGRPRVFNFSTTVTDDKLQIWIEDTVTKEQWQTKLLEVSDFTTLSTAIPRAQASDYGSRIAECLAPSCADDKATKSLSRPAADGSRVLVVGFSLQVMTFLAELEYTFTLLPIELKPTDLLASRFRDLEVRVATLTDANAGLETTVANLTAKLQAMEAKPTSGLVCARFKVSADKSRTDKLLVWTLAPGFPIDGLTVNAKTASISLGVNGVYTITLDIPRYVNLLVNGKRTRIDGAGMLILKAGDSLTVEREAIYSSASGHVSLVLTRELSQEAAEAAAKEAAAESIENQLDEPVFDAMATTGDY